jgi:hypothetical protein
VGAWATWTSPKLREGQDHATREPLVGWMTYVATPVSAGFPGVTTHSLLGGCVLRIGQDATTVQAQAVLELRTRLANLGALRPTPL